MLGAMMPTELRRRLKAADPNLTIIPGGVRKHSRAANNNWDQAAGVTCSNCGREVFRSRDGLCFPCWEDMKDKELEIRDKTGILTMFPESVIMSIVHPARKRGGEG